MNKSRRPVIAGNWKMYKTVDETCAFFEAFRPLLKNPSQSEVVLFPPAIDLQTAVAQAANCRVDIGGQNIFWQKEGAYTGEISARMLCALGCKWVLVAHSERRQYFLETNEDACRKIRAALDAGLTPVYCIGETLDQRQEGLQHHVLGTQFHGGTGDLAAADFSRLVIAYEPVWAIGTGHVATPEIAQDIHHFIRTEIAGKYGDQAADACRILYGGSVKPDNIAGLMQQPDIDGALVGGASLDPQSFAKIANY